LAKYAAAFFWDIVPLGDPLQLALQPADLSGLVVIAGSGRLREALLPLVERVFAVPKPRRQLRNWIALLHEI
jgi:hypothetical protein